MMSGCARPCWRSPSEDLTEDELVLRYRVEETDDGFSGEEGTFTICSFWLVSAQIGELDRARALCGLRRCSCTPRRSTRIPGTFPQAFSHLALINAVMHLGSGRTSQLSAEAIRHPDLTMSSDHLLIGPPPGSPPLPAVETLGARR